MSVEGFCEGRSDWGRLLCEAMVAEWQEHVSEADTLNNRATVNF
jgi:hypothetical protein